MINLKKFAGREEAADFVNNLTVSMLQELLVDLIMERQDTVIPKRIPITREQFDVHFRILGETGETRGRPRKEPVKE